MLECGIFIRLTGKVGDRGLLSDFGFRRWITYYIRVYVLNIIWGKCLVWRYDLVGNECGFQVRDISTVLGFEEERMELWSGGGMERGSDVRRRRKRRSWFSALTREAMRSVGSCRLVRVRRGGVGVERARALSEVAAP